jgi:hypothetical protein
MLKLESGVASTTPARRLGSVLGFLRRTALRDPETVDRGENGRN